MSRVRFVLGGLFLTCVAIPACKGKPALPEEFEYMFWSTDKRLIGATLLAQGRRAVFKDERGQSALAKLMIPRTGPLVGEDVKAEIQTPCGVREIPLKGDLTAARETEERTSIAGFIRIDVTTESAVPASVDVWTDAKGQKIGIGKAVFDGPAPSFVIREGYLSLFDAGCEASYPVTIGGAEIGKVEAAKIANKSLFITAKKDVCYHYEAVAYGGYPATGGVQLKGSQVHVIEKDRIEYFLTNAPSTLNGPERRVWELVEAPCQ